MRRTDWIDMAKGYGILGVIIGHIATPGITVWIYTFHIPMFFFLSGYLFKTNYSFDNFLKRRVKSLLIPYFCLSVPVLFHELVYSKGLSFGWNDVCSEGMKVVFQERYTPLWFISSLLGANLLFYFMNRYLKNNWAKWFVVFLLVTFVLVYWNKGVGPFYWNFDISLFVMPFMLIGLQLHDNKILMKVYSRRRVLAMILFLLSNIVLGALNYHISGRKTDLFYNDVDIVPVSYLTALCGIMFIILLSRLWTIRWIQYLGRNSLLIFAWHLIAYNWIGRLYDCLNIFHTPLSLSMIFVRDLVSLALILVILIPINEVILHSRMKFILGR